MDALAGTLYGMDVETIARIFAALAFVAVAALVWAISEAIRANRGKRELAEANECWSELVAKMERERLQPNPELDRARFVMALLKLAFQGPEVVRVVLERAAVVDVEGLLPGDFEPLPDPGRESQVGDAMTAPDTEKDAGEPEKPGAYWSEKTKRWHETGSDKMISKQRAKELGADTEAA